MVKFQNGVIPINDTNLNKLQTDLQGVRGTNTSQSNITKNYIKHDNGEYEERGTISNINMSAGNGTNVTVNLCNQLTSTDYTVVCNISNPTAYWANCNIAVSNKTINSFVLNTYNTSTNNVSGLSVDYILKGRWE